MTDDTYAVRTDIVEMGLTLNFMIQFISQIEINGLRHQGLQRSLWIWFNWIYYHKMTI